MKICTWFIYVLYFLLRFLCINMNRKGGENMKAAIHPKFFNAKVRCNCGNEFQTGSTKENIHVEVCSRCHPFYTGSQKLLVEAGGRVERFRKKYGR